MGGIISIRFDVPERQRLRMLQQERGYRSLSETVRSLCGFPRRPDEGFDGSDDIASVSTLSERVIRAIDRIDDQREILSRIARHLGVPTETRAGSFDEDTPPPPLTGPPVPIETRGGHRHPELPEGFAR